MKAILFFASMTVILFLAAPSRVGAQEKKPITNTHVISMVKGGVSEGNIVKAIQQSLTSFDLSPDGIIDLTKQGVSSKIIEAMQQAAPSTSTAQPQTNNASNAQTPLDGMGPGVVTLIDSSGRIEMKIDPNEFNAGMGNPFGSTAIKSVFNGKNSRLRTTSATPAFEASAPKNAYVYNQIGLLLLTAKSDRREIETGKVANFGSDRSGFRKTDIMPIAIKEISEQATTASLYKRYSVRTAKVLEPGEYALLVGGAYYTFGIDPVPAAVLSEARIKWAAAPKLLVGSWRNDESSLMTYYVDGTVTSKFSNGRAVKGTWSLDGDFLTTIWIEADGKRLAIPDAWRLQIQELTNEKTVLKDPTGKTWRSVRVVE